MPLATPQVHSCFVALDDLSAVFVSLYCVDGKNDGSVQGKRYFSCKTNHGLFVKPEKATHRGINCAKILPAKTS